jgi:hypothetical protein
MRQPVLSRVACLVAIVLGAAGAASGAPSLQPVQGDYLVLRDGKEVGHATLSLRENGGGTWEYSSETKGTKGMASLVGLDVVENSTFRWHEGKAEGLHYDYRQSAAIKHKDRTIDFDWNAQRAKVNDNGKEFSYAIPAGTIDRSAVALVIGLRLADGAREATLPVAVKDHVEQQRFEARGPEKISVPAGSFDALRVERTDATGKGSSWYAPSVSVLPLRVEQVQGDGSKIVMELRR